MTTNEPNPWADISRTLFSGAPMPAEPTEPAEPPAPAATAPTPPPVDPFRQWVSDTEQQPAKATVVERIAAAHNVPAAALRGNTPEELTAHAQAISEAFQPSAPVIDGQGKTPPPAAGIPNDTRALLNLISAPHLRS